MYHAAPGSAHHSAPTARAAVQREITERSPSDSTRRTGGGIARSEFERILALAPAAEFAARPLITARRTSDATTMPRPICSAIAPTRLLAAMANLISVDLVARSYRRTRHSGSLPAIAPDSARALARAAVGLATQDRADRFRSPVGDNFRTRSHYDLGSPNCNSDGRATRSGVLPRSTCRTRARSLRRDRAAGRQACGRTRRI